MKTMTKVTLVASILTLAPVLALAQTLKYGHRENAPVTDNKPKPIEEQAQELETEFQRQLGSLIMSNQPAKLGAVSDFVASLKANADPQTSVALYKSAQKYLDLLQAQEIKRQQELAKMPESERAAQSDLQPNGEFKAQEKYEPARFIEQFKKYHSIDIENPTTSPSQTAP